ncbi:MAG: SCO family protein [Crocinitomicaceae bacterium]|nr:SCO family protein [Crocinitomicaceae bacterium]|tara:strand:+ start:12040 stop:12720 length:681 start_codon:yes stop_codon:yes gene_type:complete
MNKINLLTAIFFLSIVALVGFLSQLMDYEAKSNKPLPILTPCDVNPDLYDSSLKKKCLRHEIKNFNLIDQLSREVNEELIKNKIVIADFFFVSCGSICPIMTNQLERVHKKYKHNKNIIILSHTVWPEQDTPEVLLKYANLHNASHNSWRFLTGDKKEIYRLARKEYLVAPEINDTNYNHGGEADFVHTQNIVLVDQKQRIRGFYNGTDSADISRLIKDIPLLIKD